MSHPFAPEDESLRPHCIRYRYSVVLPDGCPQNFDVSAMSTDGALDLRVAFPPGVDDDPQAVSSELLDYVQVAFEQVRAEIRLDRLHDFTVFGPAATAPRAEEQAAVYGHRG